MKRIVLTLIGLIALGFQSDAQIGWSLEKCEQHYGRSVSPPDQVQGEGVMQYHFKSGNWELYARVSVTTHLVTGMYYSKLDRSPISMPEIKELLNENGPDLDWSVEAEAHPARADDKRWIGQKGGRRILSALYAHLEEGEGYVLNFQSGV